MDNANEEVAAENQSTPTIRNDVPKPKAIPSLMNICDDPVIKKDAKFLDALQDVFESNEISHIFKLHPKEMKSAFYEAHREMLRNVLAMLRKILTVNKKTKETSLTFWKECRIN